MSFRLPCRRLIGLAAAYLVAAQVILLPLSIASASQLLSAICTSAPGGAPSHQPADSTDGCGCAAACGTLCCASAALDGPAVADFAATPAVVQVLGPTVAVVTGGRADSRGAHHPRGPPGA